jgi:hypothetical protein
MKKILMFVALGMTLPALAFAAKPPSPGTPAGSQYHKPNATHAYGFYCAQQHLSKKHVAGTPGTPFSQCVTAMAKLAKGTTTSPKVACAALSHKRVAGQSGTPFSRCVSAGAKLLQDKH